MDVIAPPDELVYDVRADKSRSSGNHVFCHDSMLIDFCKFLLYLRAPNAKFFRNPLIIMDTYVIGRKPLITQKLLVVCAVCSKKRTNPREPPLLGVRD